MADELNHVFDPSTGDWRNTNERALLRAIYNELRIMNEILAEGLNVRSLDSLRQDPSVLNPHAD